MRISLHNQYVPYGPVGHPEAMLFEHEIGPDKSEVEGAFWSWIERYRGQNNVPTTFYNEKQTLAENGYHILRIVNGDVSDELIASLPKPRMFTPAKPGVQGRRLVEFESNIPSFFRHFDFEIWNQGAAGCDHDFGLESYAMKFKEQTTGQVYDSEAVFSDELYHADGTYYAQVTCTRCGAIHALAERA